ncbi:hypothetical protein [Clostridium sp. E02]|uniref:hypothetical protein n=1 Tax=Clostridium sp. E02 TaxID=2487134 RepID=UPI000F54A56D|nr:hypothetical protein [Clostridium sp. E02]
MSWELMNTIEKTCLCGKGHVIIKYFMDDWNRSREESYCDCEYCNKKQLEEQNKRKEMISACEKIVCYFNDNYLDQWIVYFCGMKSKKSIWERVHALKLEYCSLNSFYSRHRKLPLLKMDSYYKSYC